MAIPVRIDFVSDIACPWCAVGLRALEEAMVRVGPELQVEIHFQPFELNPQMPAEGEGAVEHLMRKYRISAAQAATNAEAIRMRGEELGFVFDMDSRRRVYNTFDSHRLLHWAGEQGQVVQRQLKHALLRAYFTLGLDVSDRETLVEVVREAGLDEVRARQILESEELADAVRRQERYYAEQGISAVPSVIFNNRHLIQGGQPVDAFEAVLRRLAALPANA